MSMNKVILCGNLTRTPELKFTPNGTAVCEMSVAVNRYYKGQGGENKQEVAFIDVTVWGKQGEAVAQYLTKGRQVLIEGRITQNRWEDQDGKKRSKVFVTAEKVIFIGSKNGHRDAADPAGEEAPPEAPPEDPTAAPGVDVPF